MVSRDQIRPGMVVRARGSEKLGKVTRRDVDEFEVEKGFFFQKAYVARYEDVLDVRDGEIFLSLAADEFTESAQQSRRPSAGYGEPPVRTTRPAGAREGELRAGEGEGTRAPIGEEDAERKAGIRTESDVSHSSRRDEPE